ncbi:MAG: hypothetical protein ACQEP5_08870 [Actinomycetota bacterium]
MAETDNVSKKILKDAEKQKEKILAEAREKADRIIEQAKEKKQERLAGAKNKAEQEYQQAYELEILKARSEASQKLLLSKLKLVDETIGRAKQKIYEGSREDYLKFMKKSIDELDIKQGTYIIGKEEKTLDEDAVSSLSKDINLKKSEQEPDFPRGLKIISENREYILSPETVIDSQIEDTKMEIANLLFSGEK